MVICAVAGLLSAENDKPVISAQTRRTVKLRQRMTRDTRAGRECQVRISVPDVRMTRRAVRM